MSVLTINAFPSNSYVTVVYNSETTVGMVPFTMEIETGSIIQYKVEALQCTPDPDPSKGSEYKTLLIDEDKTLSVILNYIGAVQPDTWVPALGNETFPTHIAMLGKGGWRSVESNDERDAIPSARREAGMSVYVTSDEKLYILNEDLTTWTEFQPGSLKGGWKEVETAEERDAIPDDLLEVGMMVYVTSEAKGYILTSLNTEVTPTLKTWEEYKPGQGDYIRKITTYPVSSVSPLVDGEIIQYQGPTVPPYWNGYFYKDVQEYAYISSKSSDMGPASVRIIDEGKLKTYIRANQSAISGGWSDLKLKFTGIYSATCVATNGEVEHNMNSYSTQEQWAEFGLQISSSANYPISGSVAYIAPAHIWEQVDVQPATDLVWGNIEGDITNQTDLQEALDSKLDKSSETEKVYGTDDNGNQVVYSAGDNIEFYNKSPQVFPGAGDVSYTEVGSLKAEAGQYIDTGLNYHNEVKGPTYDITFRYINLAGDYANGAIFAGRGVEGRWGIGIDSYSRELRIIHGGGSIYNRTGITADTNWHRVYSVYDANVDGGTTYYYYDGELIFQTTKAFKTDATNTNMTIFMFGAHTEFGYTSQESTVEIASFKWYDANGNAVFDYVPVVSSLGEAGFYDKATNTFKTSTIGTAPEIEPFNEIHTINAITPVKDVKIDDSSVVDEEGIAQLGSMADESVEDYMTSAEIESALALKQDIIQYSEVPEASEELLGKIIQYTGETTQDYTNGYFYKCFDSHTYEDASAIFVGGDIANLTVDTDTFVNAGVSVDEDHFVHYSESESSWLDEDEQLVNLSDWGVSYEGFAVDGDTMNIRVNTASTTYYWTNILVQDDNGGIANGIVNQNPAEYAVNPIYDWVGTIEEYTAQDIETLHPEWVCYVTNDGGLPSGGSSSGYVQSVNGETGAVVVDEFSPEDAGAEGNVLVKTATGYTWGEGGSGKTEDENGNLYISDEFAKDGDDEQYPLIYRTKSEDDSNTIKINAPVEIIENPGGGSRSLKVSGSLSAKDTSVKSLAIDGTIRANGNIWMGRHKETLQKIQSENGVIFHREYYTGESWAWVSEDGDWQYVYSEKEIPEINDNLYVNSDLTDQYSTVTSSWEDSQWAWDSSKASIKQVKEISFHDDTNGVIDNVYKIRGQNWNIEGNGRADFNNIHSTNGNWELSGDGTFKGKKIDLNSGNNRMGSLTVEGAIKVYGESTVTGTSHIKGDIKLDPKDSGNGYSRIYPTENETSSLGTPNHRFEKIYVKDIDISGSGGVDIAHLDGVEEINENTLQFTKLADLTDGYYNEDGQYIGDTVTQYINTEDDLPVIKTGFVDSNGSTYKFGATINGITAWYNINNSDDYVYTTVEDIVLTTPVYADKECSEVISTVSLVNKSANISSIMGGFNYDGEIEEVSEIGVTPPDCASISISDPGNRLLGKDIIYSYFGIPGGGGSGPYTNYSVFRNESAIASDWSDGVQRRYVWIYNDSVPAPGIEVAFICDSSSDPTVNALTFGSDIPYVSSAVRLSAQCLKGAGSEEYIKTFISSQGFWLRKDSNGNLIYGWTTDSNNPRVGDEIYEATSSGAKLSNVIDTVSKVIIPANSVAISSDTGTATVHNYTQKHFNFYQPVLQDVAGESSRAMFEYSGYFGQDWTRYPPVSANWNAQRVRLNVNSYPSSIAYVDNWESTFAINQSFVIYNESYFMRILQAQQNTDYIIISKSDSVDTDIKIDLYYSDGTLASSIENNLTSEGKCVYFGFQLVGVTTVDENTSIMVRFGANANVVQYSLNANDNLPVYQTTNLIDKSDLVWAFYADSYQGNSSDCMFCMVGSTTTGGLANAVQYRFEYFINSVERTGSWTTRKIRNPQVGDTLYAYWGNAPININPFATNRPVVKARTLVKAHRWRNSSNGLEYTFERNPGTDSHYWHHDMWGGIYSPVDWRVIGTVVPASISGIYYINSTSQYVYYNGSNFQECFYHKEVQDNVYSDIKLNNFHYWRALDGSYTFLDGKEHEVVATKFDLPRPNLITISVEGANDKFFVRSPNYDISGKLAWTPDGESSPVYYTDADIFVNHVGDIIYDENGDGAGTITNIAYNYEVIKFNNRNYELDMGNSSANSYYCWTNSDYGEQIYTRTPNPEVNDTVYWDSDFESEAGSITEIVSGEPVIGTFYEVETIPSDESGRYFWNGNNFVEAEKLYKSITIYGEDNNLGKPRNPWNNVYAKSIESPYGTVTTRDGYLEVNGGKITNVTMINYNGADYIYTSVNVINRLAIEDSSDNSNRCEPVELGLNYCKWQSETNPEIVYYTPDTDISGDDDLYLDADCTEKSEYTISDVIETPTQVFTWTSTSGNVVYSLIRQLLEDDEVFDNNLCIRKANPMLITSSQFTDIFQESIIMNNNSITLVLRDINGDVTGSCMLNATKLNKLEQLLQNA